VAAAFMFRAAIPLSGIVVKIRQGAVSSGIDPMYVCVYVLSSLNMICMYMYVLSSLNMICMYVCMC
jgi:hypothetical protein